MDSSTSHAPADAGRSTARVRNGTWSPLSSPRGAGDGHASSRSSRASSPRRGPEAIQISPPTSPKYESHRGMDWSQQSPRGESNTEVEKPEPGVRRSVWHEFQELRRTYSEERKALAGPRMDHFARIIDDGDVRALARLAETGQAEEKKKPSLGGQRSSFSLGTSSSSEEKPVCSWCNARVDIEIQKRRPSFFGKRGDGYAQGENTSLARACQLCLRLHCQKCRSFVNEIAPLINSPALAAAGLQSLKLQTCGICHRFIDGLRWRKESPLTALTPCSNQLFSQHSDMARRLTRLQQALTQLDGLARTAEMSDDMPEVLRDALDASCSSVRSVQREIENAVSTIAAISCPPLPHRNAKVRDNLVRHAQNLLLDLKPRVAAAMARVEQQQKHRKAERSPPIVLVGLDGI